MLCSKELKIRMRQMGELAERTEAGIVPELNRLLPAVDKLDAGHFLPLAELAVRALRQLSPEQYEIFRQKLQWLIESDPQIDPFEYMREHMIVWHPEPHFPPVKKPRTQYYTLKALLQECAVLLSGLARIGSESNEEARAAFAQGAKFLEAGPELQFLPLTECNLLQIDVAINRVTQASPTLKQRILTALICAAAKDGQLQRREAEMVRAVADAWAIRVPPFLCAPPDQPVGKSRG